MGRATKRALPESSDQSELKVPKSAVPIVLYGLAGVGSIASIISLAVSAFSGGTLSGGWLFASLIAPIIVLVALLAYLMRWSESVASELRDDISTAQGEVEQEKQRADELATLSDKDKELAFHLYEVGRRAIADSSKLVGPPGNEEDKRLGRLIKDICVDMAAAFRKRTGHPVRVCVKQVMETPNGQAGAHVKTVQRSGQLSQLDTEKWHAVAENTDFDMLFERRTEFWFCPDISDSDINPDYRTTSVGEKLYKSVIVWPVITRALDGEKSKVMPLSVSAFLCLDSNVPHLFDEKRDVALGRMVADGLARLFEAHFLVPSPDRK